MILTLNQLKQIFPKTSDVIIERYRPHLNNWMNFYKIDTFARITCFLAQIGHESGGLIYAEEIASGRLYEGRTDLGNTQVGDGVKFKGRGLIQITGRSNYAQLDKEFGNIGLIEDPSILKQPSYAVRSACWYWISRGLNDIADKPDNWTKNYLNKTRTKFEWITIKINGGLNGLADRVAYWNRAKKALQP